MPRVSVVIATYNSSRVLRCALQSVCAQTYDDFDVWIVGDACTDDSAAVVEAFGDRRLHWVNLPSRVGGQYGPNNEGLRRASGEFIAYLGHDDLWFPWHLASVMAVVDQTGADFAYGGVVFMGPEGPREVYGNRKERAQVSVSPPSGWLHRRAIVDTCGPWRPPAVESIGTDVGFQARAFLAGYRFEPSRRVSVLKFPSHWWTLYARNDYPQETYLGRMRDDVDGLLRDVLNDLVFTYAERCDTPTVTAALARAFRAVERELGERYGVDRWPLSQYLRWRSARRRRRALVDRGLAPEGDRA
ncbi:MAG: glycosyltransferase family 2 protein [Vicinamibacterales bacterium]